MITTKCNRCHVKNLFWNTVSYSIFWIFFVDIFEQTSLLQNADNHKTRKWWWSDLKCDVLIWWITTSTHLWPSKNILIIYPHNTKPSCLCQKIRYNPELQEAAMDEMKSDTGNKSKTGKDLAPGAHELDPHLPPKRLCYPCLVAI